MEVFYTLAPSEFSLREPVVVEFELTNTTDAPIQADLGPSRNRAFILNVTYPDGETLSSVSLPRVYGLHVSGEITVSPGEAYRQPLLLNEWIDFPDVGVYLVEILLTNPIRTMTGQELISEPFRTQINILPRNAARLREVCERLTSEIEATASVEPAMRAAEALGYVQDVIAVPYLERALASQRYVDRQIFDGLERIGNREAVDVLIKVIEDAGEQELDVSTRIGTRAVLARQALTRVYAATADSEFRRFIEQFVSPPSVRSRD